MTSATPEHRDVTVTYFPYAPGMNPFQTMFRQALEAAGVVVRPEPPHKWLPLRIAAQRTSDVLHVDWIHDLYMGRNLMTSLAKRVMYGDGLRAIRRVPVVWTVHNLVAHDSNLDATEQVRLLQKFADICDGLLFLSSSSEEEFRRLYRVGLHVATIVSHHGHFIDCYPNDTDPHTARRILGIRPDARVAASIGRLHPYKGIEDLMDAFDQVATDKDVLLIAGRPSSDRYASRLQALASEHSRHARGEILLKLGAIPSSAMQYYYNAADFAVLPFRHILNSGSALLAAGFGLPLLGPAIGSLPEQVTPEIGILYEQNELEPALASMLSMCDGTYGMDRSSRIEFVRRRFAWKPLARAACDLYASYPSPAGGH